jgi:hypothetical protein
MALTMEARRSSEASVNFYLAVRHHIPEGVLFIVNRRENRNCNMKEKVIALWFTTLKKKIQNTEFWVLS